MFCVVHNITEIQYVFYSISVYFPTRCLNWRRQDDTLLPIRADKLYYDAAAFAQDENNKTLGREPITSIYINIVIPSTTYSPVCLAHMCKSIGVVKKLKF